MMSFSLHDCCADMPPRCTGALRRTTTALAPASRIVHQNGTLQSPCLHATGSNMVVPSTAHKPVTLVSFDVDGTLIESIGEKANYLHKLAFAHGFKTVFNAETHIDVIKHHGGTDPLIIIKVLEHYGIPRQEVVAKLPEVQNVMIDYFVSEAQFASEGLRLLPGVKHLLETLKARDDVATCLVTGNLEPIGWAKMRSLGIEHLFSQPPFGGFGTDFCSGNTEEMWKDRMEFVRIAAKKCAVDFPGGIKAHYHVGDTPMDVQAAIGAGARALGVTTGIFSKEELYAAAGSSADQTVVLEGLADVDMVLKALNLE